MIKTSQQILHLAQFVWLKNSKGYKSKIEMIFQNYSNWILNKV